MKIIYVHGKMSNYEKETVLNYNCEDKKWEMYTVVMKHYNKAKRQGWDQTVEYRRDDGSICGGVFEAPGYCITFRNTEKKQMSEKQMQNLIMDDKDDE